MKGRKIHLVIFLLLVTAALVLGACAGQNGSPQPGTGAQSTQPAETEVLPETGETETPSIGEEGSTTPEAVSHGNEVGGLVELVDALRGAGAQVEPAGQVEQEFFLPAGQLIKVNGVDVQVFEYPDETSRMWDSDKISPDGSSIGTSMVTWVDQPNFWAKGRLIVLYLGEDPGMISLLDSILGESITTH